jgi:type I restriction enzyme S subunit
MLDDLKPYQTMKDSGVSWLAQVPSHWDVLPAFSVYTPRQAKNSGLVESTVLSLSYGRIVVRPPEKLRGLVPESFETYQIVEPGNIIVRTTDLQNDQTSLRVGHAHQRGIITSAYLCLETTPIVLNRYGFQYLNTCDLLKVIYALGSGLRQNLNFSDIKRMPVLVPPKEEQAAIVRFLDYVDQRIRRYIRAKQKLIKLLEEQKQAIIHRAVTRGLDPDVRLRPSGIQRLGDIPAHWARIAIRHLAAPGRSTLVNGPFGSDLLTTELTQSGVPVIYIRDISGGAYRRVSQAYVTERKAATLSFCRVKPGDVLVAKVGDPPGTAAIYPADQPEGIVTQDVIRIRPDTTRVIPEYLVTYLNSPAGRIALGPSVVESTRGRVSLPDFKAIPVLLPPIAEQLKILEAISGITNDILRLRAKTQREIDVLREYRTRLIADVVTGKLDVREAAARLPDEPEPEPLDEIEDDSDAEEAGGEDAAELTEETEA